ncbi:MAG TPA: ATP-binding protein [Terracidiphilus sp.]
MNMLHASAIDRMPWYLRTLLGCGAALGSVALTYAISPLRAFPLLIGFPAVILCAWFFGMAGSFGCALLEVILVDIFLTKAQFRFNIGFAHQEERLALFLILSTLVGVLIRRWAEQRAELNAQELKKSLILEQAQRQMAEERLRSGEALRERNAALQIALRASGMGFWTWDLLQDTVHWSDEVYRIIGAEPGSFPPENELWYRAVHPDDAISVREGVAQIIANGREFRREYRVLRPDGTIRWVESQGQCQRDAQNHATWIMGVLTDVTHRKHAEEAMLRAEKLAVAGRLAASVAHEINNPLEAIANLLYLITISDTADEAHTHARHALDELLRVSLITQSTLKFHRQLGIPKITMLSEVMESVIALFRPRLNAAGIVVDVRASNEIAIACMPSEAQQIFANLIANAIEATTRSGKLVIWLHPSRNWRDRSQEGMRVTICDSGVGMDRTTLRHIFEPFFTTKPDTGTGLGMWVVAQLVERHGGNIRVWSRQRYGSSGTAFSIFLPCSPTLDFEGVEVESGVVPTVAVES